MGDALEAPRDGLDHPVSAPVEREPAVHRRHGRPFQHRAQYDLVHQGSGMLEV